MAAEGPWIVLVRHGETAWSAAGRHTGRTDVPLTDGGLEAASTLASRLDEWRFGLVLTSPLARAVATCEAAGLAGRAEICPDLAEWDYGDYEGRTGLEIRAERPGWTVWDGGCPGGETIAEVGARADRVVERLVAAGRDAAVFGHGHMLRVLTARWLGLPPASGALFALDTATLCVLGRERGHRVVVRWNQAPGS